MAGPVHEPLRELGRFLEPGLLILVSLADRPRHGYSMMEEIERLSGARPGPGTLYGALGRLQAMGLIEPLPAEDRRRPYRLTSAGAAFHKAQLERLDRLVHTGRQKWGMVS